MRLTCLLLVLAAPCFAQNARQLNYLDENNPYYPGLKFPKLITPQWVGEEGVDAVIILGIDDMRDTAKYEQYLRPILTRLKKIDGRAPVSIMTNKVKPDDPQLQSWLDEGLSLECHTVDHPCPLLKDGDFDKAKSTYDRCVDAMGSIPRNKPVAFRMPCCDSLNTVSPRFFSEIFNKTTEKKNYLTIDTSVFNFFTSDDPDIPRELIIDKDGQDKFLKYMPADRGFVNYVKNYPYPYVINKLCWEFPCVAPSDWSAQHKHGVNNQVTVDDWKAAIDITVVKKGVFCLVFHPHGWIKSEQIVEMIDHAVAKHGKKVKFLTFKEASERLNENFLRGRSMRPMKSQDMRFQIDTDWDYVGITLPGTKESKGLVVWEWEDGSSGDAVGWYKPLLGGSGAGYPWYDEADQREAENEPTELGTFGMHVQASRVELQEREFLHIDGREKLPSFVIERIQAIAAKDPRSRLLKGDGAGVLVDHVAGLRVFDLNGDGFRDLVYSDPVQYGVFLFDKEQQGWTTAILARKRGPETNADDILPIVNADFTDNGFFIHGNAMYWQNEDTAKEPHLVIKRTFAEILAAGKK